METLARVPQTLALKADPKAGIFLGMSEFGPLQNNPKP